MAKNFLTAITGISFNSITGLSSTTPVVAGTAAVGSGTTAARGDHVHPAQTSVTGNAGTVTNGVYTTNKDASGGYAGLTLFNINFKNVANTFTSFFTNTNTASRTYTFPDKDGTVAMLSDITGSGGATISDTAPVGPSAGALWWDSTAATLFVYFNDGTSSQWVEASVAKPGADGADGTTYTTSSSVQLGSLGIGTPASGVTGEIRATNNVTAYYTSDKRLKENIVPIENALSKLGKIRGVTFDWTDEEIENRGGIDGYFVRKNDVGVIAQEIESVLPEAVATRENGYKAVRYELIVPLLIEALKEQQKQIDLMQIQLGMKND
jgi:hypothetical protein